MDIEIIVTLYFPSETFFIIIINRRINRVQLQNVMVLKII